MVKKSSYFTIVFEGDIYYFHNGKLDIWVHHSSALRCINLKMIFNLYFTLQPKLFQLFQGLLEKYDPQQYLIENFIKLTSCSSNLVEYLFFHIRLWKMYHVPLKDLWMSLRTSSKIQIIINNLMLFKHQNGLLLITQEKKKEKITPYCHYPFTSPCHVRSCFICFSRNSILQKFLGTRHLFKTRHLTFNLKLLTHRQRD